MQAARRTLISVPRWASSSRCTLQASFSTSLSARAQVPPASSTSKASSSAPAAASSAKQPTAKKAASICPPGTVMTGLSILKDQPDPIAKADEEYPDWLWTLSDPPKPAILKEGEIDFEAEKKKLRKMNRANIKAKNYLKST